MGNQCRFNLGDKAYYHESYRTDDNLKFEVAIISFSVEMIERTKEGYYIGGEADEDGYRCVHMSQECCYKTLDECKAAVINALNKEIEVIKNYELEDD